MKKLLPCPNVKCREENEISYYAAMSESGEMSVNVSCVACGFCSARVLYEPYDMKARDLAYREAAAQWNALCRIDEKGNKT